MSNNTIILIEYESGKVEWKPSTTETLSYIAAWNDFIESVREVEAGADAPTDDAAEKLKQAEDMSSGEAAWFEQHLWNELGKARDERDEALARMIAAEEQLQQAKAQKLQAVKVLVGVDECCEACRVTSENENRRRVGGDDE